MNVSADYLEILQNSPMCNFPKLVEKILLAEFLFKQQELLQTNFVDKPCSGRKSVINEVVLLKKSISIDTYR